ncbi:OmpA family protein [Plastoroseomonas arctica]|uniref:OmpA family protein n=1 Tax=Plastoroseomonas arctica TaxID=1509237 RepID=A0AAF1JWH7_9PROT|nr:OmpA family protein [Plastoroseomonas arctica]MBR0655396.1 OmpA family protein [Plastoroseomonas arctica]
MTKFPALMVAMLSVPALLSPAIAQPAASPDPLVGRIIDQLTPGSTRGIRVPQQEVTQPGQPLPRARQPDAPIRADTTAPAGTPALSVLVNFASGSATLTSAAERALAPVGQALASAALSNFRFRIEGHTDTTGDAAGNQQLSERRAAAVRDFLVQRYGVNPSRLEVVGLGETNLLVRTGSQVSEVRNRRVQVLNIGS